MSYSVLLYHEIRERGMLRPGQTSPIEVAQDYQDQLPAPLFITQEQFAEQMSYLAENGYHTLTLSEVEHYHSDNAELPEKSVLLTFDDCYQSIGRYAYSVLKQYGFHAVAFVVTGWLNAQPKSFTPEHSVCMTQEELSQMTDVFEYANHTHSFHTRMDATTSRMMTANEQELVADLKQCNDHPLIQAKRAFAYPFGLYTAQNVKLLREEGFRLAFTCEAGRNESMTDPLLLKRNVIPYMMDMETFRRVVE
jgi:peptidoglycan/xylan/chitin deacetylase (PgdA/CDA1 family)